MSHSGVSTEEIGRLVGHSSTRSPKPSTAANSARSLVPASRSWTASSALSSAPTAGRRTAFLRSAP